jgi:HSP20 family protein
MEPLKDLRSRLEEKIGRAWGLLTEGWRELLSRSGGALTQFDTSSKTTDPPPAREDFPRWSLLAAETWETAQSVIIRIEVPGMRKEDLDISIRANVLVVCGVKRSEGEHEGRRYSLMERAYGTFERTIPVPHEIDRDRAEVTYRDGVLTVILPKTEPTPPRQLSVS